MEQSTMAPQQEQPEGDVSEVAARAECLRLMGADIGRALMNPPADIGQAQVYAAFVLDPLAIGLRRLRLDLLRATLGDTPEERIVRVRAYEAFILRGEAPPEGS